MELSTEEQRTQLEVGWEAVGGKLGLEPRPASLGGMRSTTY